MSAFCDSSALVKLYADEDGNEVVRALEAIAVSVLVRIEVPAALWRKARLGELASEHTATLVDAFEADLFGSADEQPAFAIVDLEMSLLDDAAAKAAAHGLRAYDAVQLASALAAHAADPGCDTLACFDDDLRAAAAASGLGLIP